MKTKLILLALVLVSQIFYVKYSIVPEFKAANVKPGQVWEYKCSEPFHDKDAPEQRTVVAIKDGIVQYTIPAPELPGGTFTWDCPGRVFVADAKLVKDVK